MLCIFVFQSGTSVSLLTFSWKSWASHVEVTYLLCRMPPLTQQLPAQPRWCTAIHRSACADGPAAGAPRCMSALTRELMVSLPDTLHPHCKLAGLLHRTCIDDKQALPPLMMSSDNLLGSSDTLRLSGARKRERGLFTTAQLQQAAAACLSGEPPAAEHSSSGVLPLTGLLTSDSNWLMAMPLQWPAVEQSCRRDHVQRCGAGCSCQVAAARSQSCLACLQRSRAAAVAC